MPVQALVLIPLDKLAELAAHEQQFLARMGRGEPQESPQPGELLPVIARHLVQQRLFAVDHFVMRQRQDEIFRVYVHHRKRHQIVAPRPEQRVLLGVAEHVVHPAHVPLVVESQTAFMGGTGHAGPGRRFLGDHQCGGESGENRFVQLAQESDGVEIFPAAMPVRPPLPRPPGKIQIQKVGHGVDPQPIEMVHIKPEHRVGNQKAANLRTPQVEIERSPFHIFRLQPVPRLEQRFPVKAGQTVVVFAEMTRHPVQDHADPFFMGPVHQKLKIRRAAIPAGYGVIAGLLVAPGPVQRMLRHRQQFQMRITHVGRIIDQFIGQITVGQK